jgi:hypothetical protein
LVLIDHVLGSITVERASRILEALGVELVSELEPGPKA